MSRDFKDACLIGLGMLAAALFFAMLLGGAAGLSDISPRVVRPPASDGGK